MIGSSLSLNVSEFWSESFWLPRNEKWAGFNGTNPTELAYTIPVAFVLCFLRIIFYNAFWRFSLYRCIFTPLGLYSGLKPKRIRYVPHVPLLESFYAKHYRPTNKEIEALAKKLDISYIRVSAWFKGKRNLKKFPVIVKFTESGWKCSFYFGVFVYGSYCLYQEPFLYHASEFFRNYPHHQMSASIFWYYMIELAYYLTGHLWIFLEVKRKDFWVMLIHHFATVSLISFSYLTNYFRIGTVIMLIHDSADFWLEGAKMFKYIGLFTLCKTCFATFVIVWTVTRLYFFPFCIISSIFTEAPKLIGFYPALNVFAAFLLILQLLHLFWTVQIVRTAITPFLTGEVASDARSESEMSETETDTQSQIDFSNGKLTANGTANNSFRYD